MKTNGTEIVSQYQQGLDYLRTKRYSDKWPEYERFKAGEQWPPPTEDTQNLPRPVFNIIDYIENHKIASVMNENIKMNFTAQELPSKESPELQSAVDGADAFSKMADVLWESLKQDEINEEVLESASNLGTGIAHYYWDDSVITGIKLQGIGELRGESLDPMNVFFGNPQNKKVHKQPHIIISSREMLQAVKDEAKKNNVPQSQIDKIVADDKKKEEGYDSAQFEVKDGEKVTVLTRYIRKNGTIWMEKCTANGITYFPEVDTMKTRYPVAVMQWKNRKKSIHGVGDTEGLIPNQKLINLLLAMMALSSQMTAFPKLLVKPNSLQQTITNKIGEIITDMGPPGQDNIKFMQPGNFNPTTFGLIDKFVDMTKQMSAAQDAATGDMNPSNNTAAGIMMLQKAAGVPLESIKKRFYRFCEDVGLIWEEFFKVNYALPRAVRFKDEDGNEYPAVFNGLQYSDVGMTLRIDIGPSTESSEALMVQKLDDFLAGQYITFEDYLEFAPKNVVPFKDRLKKRIEERQQQSAIQQDMQMNAESRLNQFINSRTPEEKQFIAENPDMQEEIINTIGGGQNGNTAQVMPNMR